MDKEKMFDFLDTLTLTGVQETTEAILSYLHWDNNVSWADVMEAEWLAWEYWRARLYDDNEY